jgi:hypothetical protein
MSGAGDTSRHRRQNGRSKMPSMIAQIRACLNLTDVITSYGVVLHPHGRRAVGLCAFHIERTPSFTVFTEQQKFHCFGCHFGGDVIDFVARIEGISLRDAIRQLAVRAGITLVPAGGDAIASPAPPSALLAVDTVPAESDIGWIRAARKAEFDRLVLVLDAVAQRIRVAVSQIDSDADWERLHAAYLQQDSVTAEVIVFWEQPGFLPLGDFLTRYLDVDAAYGGGPSPVDMTREEFAMHMLRPTVVPDARGGAAEWVDWLQPASAALVRLVRDVMRKPLGPFEIEEVLQRRRRQTRQSGAARPSVTGVTDVVETCGAVATPASPVAATEVAP